MTKALRTFLLATAAVAGCAAAMPAAALPTPDNGYLGMGAAYNLTYRDANGNGQGSSPIAQQSLTLGANGASIGNQLIGDFGGVNYSTTFTFMLNQSPGQNWNGSGLSLYGEAIGSPSPITYTLNSITTTLPSFAASAQTYSALQSGTVLSASGSIGTTPFAGSSVPATISYLQNITPVYVTITASAGHIGLGGGSGVPGPVAGVGLPVMAAAAFMAMRRRRRAASAA